MTLIEIDFGDENGFQLIELDQNYNVTYPNEGEKQISYRLTFDNGFEIESVSKLNVIYSNEELNQKFNQAK